MQPAEKCNRGTGSHSWPTAHETSELVAQAAAIAAALWLLFRFPPAIPYQPLYVLFIPVIWISVRHGLQGASLATFTVNCAAMFLADDNHSEVIDFLGCNWRCWPWHLLDSALEPSSRSDGESRKL